MRPTHEKRILARVEPDEVIGRSAYFDRLVELSNSSNGITLLSAPSVGLSEILRSTFDRVFNARKEVMPFYFEIRRSDRSAKAMALRFMSEFMLHAVAFRRQEVGILDIAPEVNEIADLATPDDGYWIDRMAESLASGQKDDDSRSWVRNCLSSPMRAVASGAKPFVIIDNVHVAADLVDGEALIEDLCDIYGRGKLPFVFGGHRRHLYARTPFESVVLEQLPVSDAAALVENRAARFGVAINEQTRDLIAVQLGGKAGHISKLLAAAARTGEDLASFASVEKTYADEIFGGTIARSYDSMVELAVSDTYARERVLWLLNETLNAKGSRVSASFWLSHGSRAGFGAGRVLETLHENEIVNLSSGSVEIDSTDIVLCDYLRARAVLEIDRRPRGLAVGEAVSEYVERAPRLMARYYREKSALPLRSLMTSFNGQKISSAALDYSRFKQEFKGAEDDAILRALKEDNSSIDLPQIVYTAATSSFYPILSELCDPERSATALGFSGKESVVWIAAQIESKLEAASELAAFWCDRLEMAAINSDFENFRLWLIAPEGFSPDAMGLLAERGAFGSSVKQVEILAQLIGSELRSEPAAGADEYEVVVPMGEDTELIAAHTLEEIAKRYDFPAKAINQVKTALVEACINATEHSLSPDRKIHQKFIVAPDRITITVTNRGLRLADRSAPDTERDENRRGWGLKLMKGLMNDVTVERTDDGTKITMVKLIEHSATTDTRA